MTDQVPDKSDDLGDEAPEAAELAKPSTQKDPGEEPTAAEADAETDDGDAGAEAPAGQNPDHQAVGIGIPGQPQVGENITD
jgi:hypothetical protein